MSLTDLITLPAVKALLDPLAPSYVRTLRRARCVEPPSRDHAALVGTAFDYALRIELRRAARHAATGRAITTSRWIAENAAFMYAHHMDDPNLRGRLGRSQEVAARRAVGAARVFEAEWLRFARVSRDGRAELAWHAVALAGLDPYYRIGARALPLQLSPAPAAVGQVAALLEVLPIDTLLHEGTPVLLNPSFGEASRDVGGADADLVLGDLLVEVKVDREAVVERRTVRQLLGYALLARAARRDASHMPEVRRIAVYFARHAHLEVLGAIAGTSEELDAAADELRRLGRARCRERKDRWLWLLADIQERARHRSPTAAHRATSDRPKVGRGGGRADPGAAPASTTPPSRQHRVSRGGATRRPVEQVHQTAPRRPAKPRRSRQRH